jgi:hypothetical protein
MLLGNTYRYDVIASDPDGGPLIYSLNPSSIAAGMKLDAECSYAPGSAE